MVEGSIAEKDYSAAACAHNRSQTSILGETK